MKIHAPLEDMIIASPVAYGSEVIQSRCLKRRVQGSWENRQARIQFWVFALLDGKKHHRRISEILSIPEPEVRAAMIELTLQHLITIAVHEQEDKTLNARLLHESFLGIKPNGMAFAEAFYLRLFDLGRKMLGTNEIEQLFRARGTDMQKQYVALLGALAFVIAGVLENKDIEADLADLGKRHHEYGVKEIHYQIVGMSLIETLQSYFGPKWTEELQQTWEQAYKLVAGIMQKATV
jgi:hemoglobin-like flavoprotein